MLSYKVFIDDYFFIFYDFLEIEKWDDFFGFVELMFDMMLVILEGGVKFCEEVLQLLNQVGDEYGCVFENGVVCIFFGFKEVWDKYCEVGWNWFGVLEKYDGVVFLVVLIFVFFEIGLFVN